MKRDKAIDFWRGLACISVIFIHTVFHSGDAYVPRSIACWSLLFDVPIFMLLAGMTYAKKPVMERKIKEILNLIFKWIFFVIFCYIFLLILDYDHIKYTDFVNWIVFVPQSSSMYVIGVINSLWFMIYYIQASLVSIFLLELLKKKEFDKKLIIQMILLLFFILVSINCGVSWFDLSSTLVSYVLFFVVGFLAEREVFFKNGRQFIRAEILLIFSILVLFHVFGYTIVNLQGLKLPSMHYLYVLVSFVSIFVVIYFKRKNFYDKKICVPILFVGKKSFYMYFAQGISSSLLFFISPYIRLSVGYKIVVMFVINLVISIILFLIIDLLYKVIDIIKEKILKFQR